MSRSYGFGSTENKKKQREGLSLRSASEPRRLYHNHSMNHWRFPRIVSGPDATESLRSDCQMGLIGGNDSHYRWPVALPPLINHPDPYVAEEATSPYACVHTAATSHLSAQTERVTAQDGLLRL